MTVQSVQSFVVVVNEEVSVSVGSSAEGEKQSMAELKLGGKIWGHGMKR